MGFLRFCLTVLVLLAASLKVTPAQAANTLTLGTITWLEGRDNRSTKQINRDDCINNRTLQVGYTYTGTPSVAFEAWAGTGCEVYTNRSNTTGGRTCVLVGRPGLNDRTINIKAADLVKPKEDTSEPGVSTDSACNPASSVSGFQNRKLFLIVYNTGDNSTVVSTTWDYSYDIVGPAAPSGLTAEAGDLTLITKFTGSKDTDVQNYRFFCARSQEAPANTGGSGGTTSTAGTAGMDAGGTMTAAGADTGGAATAGTDTGGTAGSGGTAGTSGTAATSAGTAGTAGTAATINPACYTPELIPGKAPDSGVLACGTIAAQGSSGGETDPDLENDITWAVAVASVDQAGNVGPLSELACGTPADTVGFYEAYRNAGGKAGGGFCSYAPGRRGTLATLFGFLGLGALAFWRRRR